MAYYGSGPQWQPPPSGQYWPQPQPVDPAAADGAFRWFKVYVGVMAALYLILVGVGIVLLVAPFGGTDQEVTDQRLAGGFYGFLGLVLLVVFGIGLFLPRRPWGWIYGIVLLGLGMTSCCTLPAAIPLLIAWLKPEMKARFNKT